MVPMLLQFLKAGERKNPANYSPTSLTFVPGKFMEWVERLVRNALVEHITNNNLFAGFLAGKSCTTRFFFFFFFFSSFFFFPHILRETIFVKNKNIVTIYGVLIQSKESRLKTVQTSCYAFPIYHLKLPLTMIINDLKAFPFLRINYLI